ncbi:hypothetical protein ELI_0683 [Eubacterium callanderi]|uniref:Uncharacterized protein n=1 Tax=Eubacterium callanderi TaxID=53442 RepID=E3GJ62_9FIRM|nr:hypothetical protein ELI_0683 [Eubacterium callanderi]
MKNRKEGFLYHNSDSFPPVNENELWICEPTIVVCVLSDSG